MVPQTGFEPAFKFLLLRETTLPICLLGHKNGAGEEARTLDIYLGKVVLYQLSYTRNVWLLDLGSNQGPTD